MKFNELYDKVLAEDFSDFKPKRGQPVTIKKGDVQKDDELKDQIYNMIDLTYEPIGGHLKIKGKDDIPGDHDVWKLIDIDGDGDPDVVFGNKEKGKYSKIAVVATSGSKEAKKKMLAFQKEELQVPGNVSEVSDALAHVLITRYDAPFVSDPSEVEKILKKDIEWVGEHPSGKYPAHQGWYKRKIGGKEKLKILVGTAL